LILVSIREININVDTANRSKEKHIKDKTTLMRFWVLILVSWAIVDFLGFLGGNRTWNLFHWDKRFNRRILVLRKFKMNEKWRRYGDISKLKYYSLSVILITRSTWSTVSYRLHFGWQKYLKSTSLQLALQTTYILGSRKFKMKQYWRRYGDYKNQSILRFAKYNHSRSYENYTGIGTRGCVWKWMVQWLQYMTFLWHSLLEIFF